MSDELRSLLCGLASLAFAAGVTALCIVVKAAMNKLLKGGQNHDDQQKAHRHGS